MGKVDERVLSFFVSGALVVGSAACSKETKNEGPHTNTARHVDHVNEGPMPANGIDAGATKPEAEIAEPDHVNTRKEPDPKVAPEKTPHRTNVGRQDQPTPKKPVHVNTMKVPDPKTAPAPTDPAAPKTP